MNNKLFFSCLMITFGMLFWMMFQPGSLTFIGIRVTIAFVSAITMLFSVNWYEKKKWGQTSLFILLVLLLGTVMYIAFNWGLIHYPVITILVLLSLVVGILLYIKYIEPKMLNKKEEEVIPEKPYIMRGEILDRLTGERYPRNPEEIGNDWEYVKRIFPLICLGGNPQGALSILFGKSITEIEQSHKWLAGNFLTEFSRIIKEKDRKRKIDFFLRGFGNSDPAGIYV